MKILSVVGARPEFIQAMPISRAIKADHQEILVHTGQHYDYRMSQTFFEELDIPAPRYNLGVGSASRTKQISQIMLALEDVLLREQPDLVIVRGDTNSSLASALVASSLGLPLAHVEAGERSFNTEMPEELNRLVTDRLSSIHFCVSAAAMRNLNAEAIGRSVHLVGDVMLDALIRALPYARAKSKILEQLRLEPQKYALVTVHRAANTDQPERLMQIVSALNSVAETIVFPLHPRTEKVLSGLKIRPRKEIRTIDPVGYLDMLTLEENARLIATDSGGVQREAYYLGVPCLTLRDETEWSATVETGWNKLVGADPKAIAEAWFTFRPPAERPPIYGDGNAARRIAEFLGVAGSRATRSAQVLDE